MTEGSHAGAYFAEMVNQMGMKFEMRWNAGLQGLSSRARNGVCCSYEPLIRR